MEIIIKGRNPEPPKLNEANFRPTANNRRVYFPKKSHHGYYDETFGRKFYSEKEKRKFMNEHGFVEAPSASKAHIKRVKDFVAYWRDEKRKNPNFNMRNEAYPE